MSQADNLPYLDDVLTLAEQLVPHWPAIRGGIPMWHPRNEGGEGGEGGGEGGGTGQPPAATPPWGSDEEFTPGRAWKLIQDLRTENTKVKTENGELRTKVTEHETSKMSDQEKLTQRSTAAEERAKKSDAQAARLEVALEKGLTLTQAKRLVGETKEDLAKDADELLADFKSDGGDGGDGGEGGSGQASDPPRRPRERMRTGAAPNAEPDENDPAALAEKVSRGW